MFVTFLAFGIGTGLWGASIPVLTLQASVSPRLLGATMTFYMLAYLVSMSAGGALARRFSLRHILLAAIPTLGLLLALLHLARGPQTFFVALTTFGLLAGLVDLTMNAEGTRVEADRGFPLLAGLHGGASLGIAIGAITGSYFSTRFGAWSVVLVGIVVFAAALAAVFNATPERGIDPPRRRIAAGPGGRSLLTLLGIVLGISMAGEMAAATWSSPLLVSQAPAFAAYAGAGAALFALGQCVMRFQADRLRRRFGDPAILVVSLAVAFAGAVIVLASTSFGITACGFGLIGLGTACVVPCGFAYAVTHSPLPASAALSLVSLASSVPRLPTPYLIGEMAARFSIGTAFGVFVALFGIAVVISAWLVRSQPRRA